MKKSDELKIKIDNAQAEFGKLKVEEIGTKEYREARRNILKLKREYDDAIELESKIEITCYFDKDKLLKDIDYLLCDALDGGASAYWAKMTKKGNDVKAGTPLYFIKRELSIGEIEPSTDNGIISKKLNEENLLIGLKVMAQKYPYHFSNFISENADGITADVFLQCSVLGDVVYG